MSVAQGLAAVLSATVPLLVALASLLWWAYRRGEAAGEERAKRQADELTQAESKAKLEALERLLAETRTELASWQPRRRRSLQRHSVPLIFAHHGFWLWLARRLGETTGRSDNAVNLRKAAVSWRAPGDTERAVRPPDHAMIAKTF